MWAYLLILQGPQPTAMLSFGLCYTKICLAAGLCPSVGHFPPGHFPPGHFPPDSSPPWTFPPPMYDIPPSRTFPARMMKYII